LSGGNMYEWVGYTWNPLAGECPHRCEYCYVQELKRRFPQLREKYTGPIRIDEKALNQRLPKNRTIFVCSMNDLFADTIPIDYIYEILTVAGIECGQWEERIDRIFLFQTKNPRRMKDFLPYFPPHSILGTTIESNKELVKTEAPPPIERYKAMRELREIIDTDIDYKEEVYALKLMVNIEPILDFDLDVMVRWMEDIRPDFISIGADSKHKNLPEPSSQKVKILIQELEGISEVRIKKNLKRIVREVIS